MVSPTIKPSCVGASRSHRGPSVVPFAAWDGQDLASGVRRRFLSPLTLPCAENQPARPRPAYRRLHYTTECLSHLDRPYDAPRPFPILSRRRPPEIYILAYVCGPRAMDVLCSHRVLYIRMSHHARRGASGPGEEKGKTRVSREHRTGVIRQWRQSRNPRQRRRCPRCPFPVSQRRTRRPLLFAWPGDMPLGGPARGRPCAVAPC